MAALARSSRYIRLLMIQRCAPHQKSSTFLLIAINLTAPPAARKRMGCAHSRLRTKVDVRDLESSVHTGDIILFSSKHAAAHVTKCFTASTWDHCGLVVKFGHRHVFVLEYAGGVYLYPLFTRLYTYYAVQGRVITLRRLLPGQDRAEMQRKVERFVRNVLGKSPPSIPELLTAFLKQEHYIQAFIDKLAGGDNRERPEVQDDISTMFCSKLMAAIYKDVGLLAPHRAAADFMPKHFSAQYDDYLDLQKGAMLGPELPINFDSVADEVNALREQIAEDSQFKSEDAVKAITNFYLTATSGLGNLGREMTRNLSLLEMGLHGYSAAAEAAVKSKSGDPTAMPAFGEDENAAPKPASVSSAHPTKEGAGQMARGDSSGGLHLSESKSALVREVMNDEQPRSAAPEPPPRRKSNDETREPLLVTGGPVGDGEPERI